MSNKTQSPVIGKFVLENLTIGMYDDPNCVYREYIQNSADAIDKAISENLITPIEAHIHIQISKDKKSIVIEDNGTGIRESQVIATLQNVAQSDKEIGKEKGFRGIGRLGGLGYCSRLVFETSYKGEKTKSIMTWDAKRLQEIVHDKSKKESAEDVISTVTSFYVENEKEEKHYFKVIMSGVNNPNLLEDAEIRDYLKMVVPVPFESHFIFKRKIYDQLKADNLSIDEYNISLNTEPIYKAYTTNLFDESNGSKRKIGEIKDVVFFKEKDKEGNLLFWGWHSISDIQNERLNKINKARGLRLRKSNIQIGNEHRLEHLFKDTRFNFYVIGEIYGFHNGLIPNGRRDDFEDSPIFRDFKEKLKPHCQKIQQLSYDTSKMRTAIRDIEDAQKLQKDIEETLTIKGVNNKEEVEKLKIKLEEKKSKAQQGEKVLQRFKDTVSTQEDSDPMKRLFNEVVKMDLPKSETITFFEPDIKPIFRTDKLSRLSKEQRKMLVKVFDVIDKTLDKDRAEIVKQKIEEEFR
jgi:Histidine kinase-, DNA gyrase B-, and HSP90-like ATPase